MDIHTYLMTRALGALGRALSRLDTGVFGTVDGDMMTGTVIIRKTLSLTFLATETVALRAAVGILCIDSSLYSTACLVPLPVSLLVRLVIAEVS